MKYPVKKMVVPLAGTWIEINTVNFPNRLPIVVPLAGTWIEIQTGHIANGAGDVVPLAGTWIEIIRLAEAMAQNWGSFPLRERGLKFWWRVPTRYIALVVPLAGTWIEIVLPLNTQIFAYVVPLAGTWIEISLPT